jgi:glycosyltransferase involved in cell wall biosynthesis
MPLLAAVPVVVTMHDATFFSDPGLHLPGKVRFFTAWTKLSARRARRVIVPSEATKSELLRHAGLGSDRVAVIPHGVDSAVFRPPTSSEVARLRSRLGLRDDETFVAFLGTLEPRKNASLLVRAWGSATQAGLDRMTLVLAGARGWDQELDRAIADLPAGRRVLLTGYLPAEDLPALLGAAELVVYPSTGEGFGLPVLEAMACGAAVLTTPRLSLPEVGGDAVAYTEPELGSLRESLVGLLGNGEAREALRRRARERASEFSWVASAEQHARAYRAAQRG